jgi:hypothetical protein
MKNIFAPLVIAVLISAVVNQALYFLAREGAGEPFIVDIDGQGAQPAMAVAVIAPALFTVFQGVVGGVAVAALALATKRPKANWTWLTLIGLTASFIPTAFASGGVASTFLWLSLMHLVAGALIIPLVSRVMPVTKEEPSDTTEDPSTVSDSLSPQE